MTRVNAALRRLVIQRAQNCCEYCRVSQLDRNLPYEIDHIIAEKHGGLTNEANLCLACYLCNGYKGSDISSVDWANSEEVVPLFHPRKHLWDEHFRLKAEVIEPRTPQGRVTVFLLRLNSPDHLLERRLLIRLKRYPC
jgi:hypothetical protein